MPVESYIFPRREHSRYGDTFLVVSPIGFYLKTSSAELSAQMISRREDFQKPIKRYKVIDMFGKSIISTEGQEWRRHRKIVGPSFSEKSNRLVFEESLRQVEGILQTWSSASFPSPPTNDQAGTNRTNVVRTNTRADFTVENAAPETAILSFNVICAAGFGVPQLWPGESENKLEERGVPGFSTKDLTGSHTVPFGQSITNMLHGIKWFALMSPSMMSMSLENLCSVENADMLTLGVSIERSPFRVHRAVYEAFQECKAYFEELIEMEKKKIHSAGADMGTMDLLGTVYTLAIRLPKLNLYRSDGPSLN